LSQSDFSRPFLAFQNRSDKINKKVVEKMVIDQTQLYDDIWDWIDQTLHFSPDGLDQSHDFPFGPPFRIPFAYQVYGIENMSASQLSTMDSLVKQALCNAAAGGQRLFALDWQHSGFLCDPSTIGEQYSFWVEDSRFPEGGYHAFFPSFYPDGDYYFFIDEYLQFGYLSHPWRKEVWIFGEALLNEFEQIYSQLGWYKL